MTSVYAPGQDRPGGSPLYTEGSSGGVFAEWLQGATPKYAKNRGFRSDLYRNTLARILVRVEPDELQSLFLPSIGDPHVRSQLAPRLAGDPRGALGYIDYVVQRMSLAASENIQIGQTLADNYVMYTFGGAPPTATLQGALINTVQDDQATNFLRLYLEILRASKLAARQKAASLKIDSYIFTGAMTGLNLDWNGQMEVVVPFSFTFVIKHIAFVRYTQGWRPTGVGTPFATDLNAVPADVRAEVGRAATAVTLRVPPDAEELDPEEDPRVRQTPAASPGDNQPLVSRAPASATPEVASSSRPETLNYTPTVP